MPIRKWWEHAVTTWKQFRPARRRRSSARFSVETFEPRRMLSAFVVNSLADSHDVLLGDGVAADANGFTTLRAALEEANASIGADTITLPAGVVTLLAANGPLDVTENVTIFGSGASKIDGTAFDEVFAIHGAAQLHFDQVTVFSLGVLAASLRPALLTTNTRQADLVVAFSTTPSVPFAADIKTTNGWSSFKGITASEIVFEETPIVSVPKTVTFDESAVPTPEQAIDQIINALFRNEPDFVRPVGAVLPVEANREPRPISGENARPISKSDSDEKSSPMTPPESAADPSSESMSSDDESSSENFDDDEIGAILRGWADEAGWQEFDFLTRSSHTIAAHPRHASRMAVVAGALLGGISVNLWSRAERESWRVTLSMTAWRTRFERQRRRAR